MKQSLIIILTATLLLVNVAWYIKYRTLCSEFEIRFSSCEKQLIQARSFKEDASNLWRFITDSHRSILNKNLTFNLIGSNQTIHPDLLFGHKRLVIYLSDTMCSSCVDQLLFDVKKNISESLFGRILVICQYQNEDENVIWESRRFILPESQFMRLRSLIPLVDNSLCPGPVLFLTSKDQQIEFPFVQRPSTEEWITPYLEAVQNHLIN
jgi:hypothetical protein